MDLETAKFVFSIAQFLLTGGIGIYVYISNKQRVTNERMQNMETEIDGRLDDHSSRIARVEEGIKHLPSTSDIAQVRELVSRVGADVRGLQSDFNGMRELMKPMQRTIDLINDYLLNKRS